MNFKVTERYQRARGLKLKQALQFVTLLAICIWLLYHINHPHDKSSLSKITEQHSILGRKANIGWLAGKHDSDENGGKIVDKSQIWKKDVVDDQLAKGQEHNSNEYIKGISVVADDKDDQRNFKIQRKDVTVILNKTGHPNLSLEFEDENAAYSDRFDNPRKDGRENGLWGSGFDDENGVPFGLNDIAESNGTE